MREVIYIDWHITPFRADRFLETWRPAAARALAFGASNWSLTRNIEDPLHIRQSATWENHDDFERYWYSDEITAARTEVVNYYAKPILPVWHSLVGAE